MQAVYVTAAHPCKSCEQRVTAKITSLTRQPDIAYLI